MYTSLVPAPSLRQCSLHPGLPCPSRSEGAGTRLHVYMLQCQGFKGDVWLTKSSKSNIILYKYKYYSLLRCENYNTHVHVPVHNYLRLISIFWSSRACVCGRGIGTFPTCVQGPHEVCKFTLEKGIFLNQSSFSL